MTRIVAHRGASAELPENSLGAFARAIEVGADMIEFDIRRAPNGSLVISHDPINDPSPRLPTLEETLQLTQGRIQLDVELKEPGCERDAVELLTRYFPVGEFCVTSFLASVLREVRAIDPGIRIGLIFEDWNEEIRAVSESDGIDLLAAQYCLVDQAERIGKPVFAWTVDDPAIARALLQRPLVEGIITNNPRRAIAVRMECCLH